MSSFCKPTVNITVKKVTQVAKTVYEDVETEEELNGLRVWVEFVGGEGEWVTALFRSELVGNVDSYIAKKLKAATVSLARRPDHCYFSLLNLSEHDGHAPPWGSQREAADYVFRVLGDIQSAAASCGIGSTNWMLGFIGQS